MVGLFCAIILMSATHQFEIPSNSEVRSLYERAARLIAGGQVAASIEPLEAIVRQHAESPIAEVAAVHLAEGYLIGQRLTEAEQLLREWRTRIEQSQTAETLSPGLSQWARELSCRAARELAAAASGREDLTSALQWLDQATEFASAIDLPQISSERLRVRTLHLHQLLVHGQDPESFLNCLSESEQATLRFALAEQLIASRHSEQAEMQLLWLAEYAEGKPTELACWAATVDLRLAELWIARKDCASAASLLQESRHRHSASRCVHELDFLMARCAIAQIDFDLAKQHLQAITRAEETAGPEARARAHWMLGELALLQHDYPQAIAAYERAIALNACEWQSRALLQKARCQELTAAASEAAASYQQLVDFFGGTECSRIAALRLASLNSRQTVRSSSTPKVEK